MRKKPYVIGLTGSIGTGKSTTATLLRHLQVPVQESDEEVRLMLETDPQVFREVRYFFPGCIKEGKIDRQALGRRVFTDRRLLKKLESLLHPRVRTRHDAFMKAHRAQKTPLIALDIPLLFEAGYERVCDTILVTVCNPALQVRRVLKRPGMSLPILKKILETQLPGLEKQRRAPYVLDTGHAKPETFRRLKSIIMAIKRQSS